MAVRWWKAFFEQGGKEAIQKVTNATAGEFPEIASRAQLQVEEENLDKMGKMVGTLRGEFEREQREFVEAKRLFNLKLAGAEHLQLQISSAIDETQKASLENSLNLLLAQLEKDRPEVDREEQEAIDAKAALEETETAYRERGAHLRESKINLDRQISTLKRENMKADQAESIAEVRAAALGLREGETSSLSATTSALDRKINDAKSRAESARMKADVLQKPKDPVLEDSNIAAALSAASAGTTSALSAADRLAALSGRAPQAALAAPDTKA